MRNFISGVKYISWLFGHFIMYALYAIVFALYVVGSSGVGSFCACVWVGSWF